MKKTNGIIHICRNVSRPRRFIAYIYRISARVLIGGDLPGGVTGKAADDYENLIAGHHGSGRLLRSLVISLDCPISDKAISLYSAELGQCAADFRDKYSPGRPYLYAVHRLGKKLHAHVLLQNSDGDKCLEWGPETLQEMQSFEWSQNFESGRGKGKNQVKGKTSYPGKNTTAAKLAGMSVAELKKLLNDGELVIARIRKDGSPLSLVCAGKKIRVQSVAVIATDFAARLEAAMNTDDDGRYLLNLIRENCADEDQDRSNRGLSR